MSHHDQKLQQWQQGLKQQISDYDASIKKLQSENKELGSTLSQLDLKINETTSHFEGASNSERAASMGAQQEHLLQYTHTLEEELKAISSSVDRKISDDSIDEVATKDAASLAYYRMLGLQVLNTDGSVHKVKSVSSDPPNVEEFDISCSVNQFKTADKIWDSLGR